MTCMKMQISLYLFLVIILICSLDSLEGNWIAEQVQPNPPFGHMPVIIMPRKLLDPL